MSRDDEFEGAAPSSTDIVQKGSYLAAKKEALKRQMEKQSLKKDIINKVDAAKGKQDLNALKQQVQNDGQKDDQNKKDQQQKEQADKSRSFGTKSRMQEEQANKLGADTQMTAEKQVKQDAQDKKAQVELQKTDVSTEGG